jgi:DNA polymerase-3 subunit delta
VSAEPLLPVYLFTGADRPKIGRALERLRARFPDGSVEHLSAEKSDERDAATGADAVAACNALGVFGPDGARLVVVERVERWKDADVDAVAEYLASPAPASVLALVAAEPRKSRLAEVAAGHGRHLVYDTPKPRDLPGWVREQFERRGSRITSDAAQALVEIVGSDPVALETEADKIATWAAGEVVDRPQVEHLAAGVAGDSAWALTDAWGARDLRATLAACERALEHEKPFVLALRLATYVGRVRTAQALSEEGLDSSAIAKRLRIHEYPARKALAHARNYSADELGAAVVRLAELDAALKGASRLPPELELERALVDVTLEPEHVRGR